MKIQIEALRDVNWRQYREFTKLLRTITPQDEGFETLGLDELKAIMIVAAFQAGWVEGVSEEQAQKVTLEALDELHPGNVLAMGDVVYEHYGKLRTPDPN